MNDARALSAPHTSSMRALLITGVVAVAAGLVAAPLLATRSSSNSDLSTDAGPAGAPAPSGRAPMQRVEVPGRDGGPTIVYVGDKKGQLSESPATDAGPAPAGPSTAELQAQIARLQQRADELQRQQSAAQDQAQLMQETNNQLRALNAQMANAQAERQAREEQTAAQQQAVHGAIAGLGPALDMLTSGNGQVDDALDAADQSFPPQARRDIAAARDAIANSNLNLARGYIQTAIGDAQAGR